MKQIEVIESLVQGKINSEQNEDGIVVTDDFVLVVDGVTGQTDYRYHGHKPGRIARDLIIEFVPTLDPEVTREDFVQRLNDSLNRLYDKMELGEDDYQRRPQAALAIYSRYHHQVWIIADCAALIDGVVYQNHLKSDTVISEYRSLVLTVLLDQDPQASPELIDETAREVMQPWLKEVKRFANRADTPFGYGVVNGDPIPEELIMTVDLEDGDQEIVLASDGYSKLFPSLEETEAYLHQTLAEDPLGIHKHPLTRAHNPDHHSFDDRSYIRFRVTNA